MCSGLRKIIEDASSLSHRLNISELHSFITMNNIERLIYYAISLRSLLYSVQPFVRRIFDERLSVMLSPYEKET